MGTKAAGEFGWLPKVEKSGRVWELPGHREMFGGGEGAVGTLQREVTPSHPQTKENDVGLTFLVLSASRLPGWLRIKQSEFSLS